MGVIDTLTAGFHVAVRKPWLLLIPLTVEALSAGAGVGAAEAAPPPSLADPSRLAAMEQLDLLRATITDYNLLSLLALNRLLVPSVAGLRAIDPAADRVVSVSTFGQGVGMALLLVGLGLFVACRSGANGTIWRNSAGRCRCSGCG